MQQIFTLKQRPELYQAVLDLVKHSFGITSQHRIEIDFYPLFQEENWENCFVMVNDSNQLVAHIGIKIRQISIGDATFPVALIGGIAVKEEQRGQGHFRSLFETILKRFEHQVALFILWSEKNTMYEKFGFYQVGEIFEATYHGRNTINYKATTFEQISIADQECIKRLYDFAYEKKYATIKRQHDDWDAIAKITSATLLIKRDQSGEIINYAFRDKGMDLPDIIYEWYDVDLLKSRSQDGHTKIWSPVPLDKGFDHLRTFFLGLVKIGNVHLFQQFFYSIFRGKLALQTKEESFQIQEHGSTKYSAQAILEMTFSNSIPNKWPIYISGVDSI